MSRGEGINPKGWRKWSAEARTAHYNKPPKIFEKLFKNLLTNLIKYDIIYIQGKRGKPNGKLNNLRNNR